MTTLGIPFSQLIQQPKATMAKLEQSPRRRLRLGRRDGEDLILEAASRAEAEDEALSMASRLFSSLVKSEEGVGLMLLSLAEVFPWVRFLPKDDINTFLTELVDTLRASASLGNLAAVTPVVAAWKATAEIHSDPELLMAAKLSLDGADYGEVRPGDER